MVSRGLYFLTVAMVFTGCLKTKQDLRQEGTVINKTEAKKVAEIENINQDFRTLYGRVEVVENQVQKLENNEEVNALKLKISQLETKLSLLEESVATLNSYYKKGQRVAEKPLGPYEKGESFFSQKRWEDAILAYEDYRKKNPKGTSYSEATYKIGLSFKRLGMKNDAKAFFKEVVNKFPKSKAAGLAQKELKTL